MLQAGSIDRKSHCDLFSATGQVARLREIEASIEMQVMSCIAKFGAAHNESVIPIADKIKKKARPTTRNVAAITMPHQS
jgi:hypothetical protein